MILEVPLADRAALIAEDYIAAPMAKGISLDVLRRRFLDSADRIERRLGGVRHTAIKKSMTEAFTRHEAGDANGHLDWISDLLAWYYDPMYDYQLEQKNARVVFRGDAQAVRGFLAAWQDSRP